MTALKITAKGQLTLKKAVLEHLGARPGDEIDVLLGPRGQIELHRVSKPRPDISAVFGMLHRPNQAPMTIEDVDKAIADAVAEDDRRIRESF